MTIYSAAITLFLVMDPLGNIPIFLSLLDDMEPRRRQLVILRETILALGLLVLFLLFGQYILAGLHITEDSLSIGGGVVLFLISLRMIFPSHQANTERDARADAGRQQEPLLVPLAVPLIAGPSSMAMVILFATQSPDRILTWLLALILAWVPSTIILLCAGVIRRYLGRRVIIAIERLMGMILTTLSIQMLLNGLSEFLGR